MSPKSKTQPGRPGVFWTLVRLAQGDQWDEPECGEITREGFIWLQAQAKDLPPETTWTGLVQGTSGMRQVILVHADDTRYLVHRPTRRTASSLAHLVQVYSVLCHSRDATVFTDTSGALLGASRPWRSIYGYSIGELLTQNPRIINSRLQPSSFYSAMWQQLLSRHEGTWSGEIINRRKNGELVRVWQTITTVRSSEGQIEGYLGITRDMTAYHDMREQLVRSNEELQRLSRVKSEWMAIAAHDLKSPIQGVLGYVELLREEFRSFASARAEEYLGKISEVALGMVRLINNILNLQKAEAGRVELDIIRGNIRPLLRSAVELGRAAASSRGIKIHFTEEGPSWPTYFDQIKMDQAVGNILANAIKFSPKHSEIHLRHINRPGEPGLLEIDDQGPGIPDEEKQSVFQPYYQTANGKSAVRSSGGTGWGLAITQEVLRLHGGSIEARDRPGGGCRMVLTLPHNYASYSSKIWTALMFDPRERFCHPLAQLLQDQGIAYFIATTADDFRSLCGQELPNLLLIDAALTPAPEIPALMDPGTGAPLQPAIRTILWKANERPVVEKTGSLSSLELQTDQLLHRIQ